MYKLKKKEINQQYGGTDIQIGQLYIDEIIYDLKYIVNKLDTDNNILSVIINMRQNNNITDNIVPDYMLIEYIFTYYINTINTINIINITIFNNEDFLSYIEEENIFIGIREEILYIGLHFLIQENIIKNDDILNDFNNFFTENAFDPDDDNKISEIYKYLSYYDIKLNKCQINYTKLFEKIRDYPKSFNINDLKYLANCTSQIICNEDNIILETEPEILRCLDINPYNFKCIKVSNKKLDYYIHTYEPAKYITNLKRIINDDDELSKIFNLNTIDNCCNCISIVLYANNTIEYNQLRDYLYSIKKTLDIMTNNLEDYILRLYIDISVFINIYQNIKNKDYNNIFNNLKYILIHDKTETNIYFCNEILTTQKKIRSLRFIPLIDLDTNICIIREADGFVSYMDCYNIKKFTEIDNDKIAMFYEFAESHRFNTYKKNNNCNNDLETIEKLKLKIIRNNDTEITGSDNQNSLYNLYKDYDYQIWLIIDSLYLYNNSRIPYIDVFNILAGTLMCKIKFNINYFISKIKETNIKIDFIINLIDNDNIDDNCYNKILNYHTENININSKKIELNNGYDEIILRSLFHPFIRLNLKDNNEKIVSDLLNINNLVCILINNDNMILEMEQQIFSSNNNFIEEFNKEQIFQSLSVENKQFLNFIFRKFINYFIINKIILSNDKIYILDYIIDYLYKLNDLNIIENNKNYCIDLINKTFNNNLYNLFNYLYQKDYKPIFNIKANLIKNKYHIIDLSNNYLSQLDNISNILERYIIIQKDDLIMLNLSMNDYTDYTNTFIYNKLIKLNLSYNAISVISSDENFLSGINGLRKLNLSYNKIIALNFLTNLTNLYYLNLSDNQIINIELIISLDKLKYLNLSNNNLVDIGPISNLVELTNLNLSNNNNLRNIIPISSLVNLTDLNLSNNNNVVDISPISRLVDKLTNLNLSNNNNLQKFRPISTLVNLTNLNLSNNNYLQNIIPISKLVKLTKLNLSNINLVNISPISKLVKLTDLNLSNNYLADIIPISKLVNLTDLNLSNNNLVDISPILNLFKLTDLNIYQLTPIVLDIDKKNKLKILKLKNFKIKFF